ncbi:MAG: UDP-N-acetyl-D-glucosamine dehydrogenase, partial [Euryarchaeota archaeon]|nr:UDP-N-acetyl-D-glucosamine dehydrogenase [Euryarchaeota archaeon]
SYKKDIDDTRESPALDIIQLLQDGGSDVSYFDPFVDDLNLNSKSIDKIDKLNEECLKKFDLSVIVTDHSNVNYKLIKSHSKQIVDTRNVYKKEGSKKIIKLGNSIK